MTMNLYILRHGIAVEPGTPGYEKDADRPLTPEGERKLWQITEAMEALELSFDLILSSPYLRARQTAEIVAEALKARKRLELSDSLTPGGSSKKLIELLNRLQPPPDERSAGRSRTLFERADFAAGGRRHNFGGGDEEGRVVQALDRVAETWPLRRAGVAAHPQTDGPDELTPLPETTQGDSPLPSSRPLP